MTDLARCALNILQRCSDVWSALVVFHIDCARGNQLYGVSGMSECNCMRTAPSTGLQEIFAALLACAYGRATDETGMV